ncbi:MAG: DUF1190 domain-containing protein [Pseudomonadales bacterium]|nr:DUF1190 domain-containing protein [Pseudomonadales bacterium]
MKRTRFINLERMRKAPERNVFRAKPGFRAKPLCLALAGVTLASCSDTEEVVVYRNLHDCKLQNPELQEQCETAYQEALSKAASSAPKYLSRSDCEDEFGANTCVSYRSESNIDWFMPAMAGFLFAKALDRPNYYRTQPMFTSYSYHSPMRGHWTTSDGYRYGSVKDRRVTVDPKAFKPKPKVSKTISRGGFGSKVAAKSSWGGSSSKSGGWGG